MKPPVRQVHDGVSNTIISGPPRYGHLGNDRLVPPRLHNMHLLAAIAEEVLDLAAVLRIVET
jgi:hypothetical protein